MTGRLLLIGEHLDSLTQPDSAVLVLQLVYRHFILFLASIPTEAYIAFAVIFYLMGTVAFFVYLYQAITKLTRL